MGGNVSNHIWVEDATHVNGGYPVRASGTAGGAASVTDGALDYVCYTDATHKYYCEAAPQTAVTEAGWRVVRETLATGLFRYAGTGNFDQVATDLATVAGLTYGDEL